MANTSPNAAMTSNPTGPTQPSAATGVSFAGNGGLGNEPIKLPVNEKKIGSLPSSLPSSLPTKNDLGNEPIWLAADAIAKLANVSVRQIQKAAKAGRWRGTELMVRTINGGKGRGKTLQIHIDSLPAEIRSAAYNAQGVDINAPVTKTPSKSHAKKPCVRPNEAAKEQATPEALTLAQFKANIIRPALKHKRRTANRASAIERIISQPVVFPNGNAKTLSRATVTNWLNAYEATGLAGLGRKARDEKAKRVLITRPWDKAMSLYIKDGLRERIANQIEQYIKSQWAAGQTSATAVCRQAGVTLAEACKTAGCDIPDDALYKLCEIPRYLAESHRDYKLIAVKNKDAKRFFDKHTPRIKRDYSKLKPLEIIVGDVHPVDVKLTRADGTEVYPKAIAWMDVATNRVWLTLVELKPKEGIRQAHIAQSFASMCDAWGLPETLYLDNGSEYMSTEMIAGFSYLSRMTKRFKIRTDGDDLLRSLPYQPMGKPKIEGFFSILEQSFMRLLPGWVGGDRMDKKIQNVGKAPAAFDGDFNAFHETVDGLLDAYHRRPQRGHLAGKSPNEKLSDFINDGWGKVTIAQSTLLLAFSYEAKRVVDRGRVQYALPGQTSVHYYHDELLPWTGHKLTVRVAAHDPRLCFVFKDNALLCAASQEQTYHPLDRAGAKEQSRQVKHLKRFIADRKQHTDKLVLIDELKKEQAVTQAPPEVPELAKIEIATINKMLAEYEKLPTNNKPQALPDALNPQFETTDNNLLKEVNFDE